MPFANIFTQSVTCLLILLCLSQSRTFKIFIKSNLSIILFMDHSFDVFSTYLTLNLLIFPFPLRNRRLEPCLFGSAHHVHSVWS